VVGYDSAGAFVKALGIRALSDPEDAEGPPVEKERALPFFSEFSVFVYIFGKNWGLQDVASPIILHKNGYPNQKNERFVRKKEFCFSFTSPRISIAMVVCQRANGF